MEQLQKAAEALMVEPGRITQEDRHAAEQVFLQFRNSPSPFILARDILEHSENPYLLYEATAAIRTAVIREYSVFPEGDMLVLGDYLLNYVMTHVDSPPFVRETLIQVICIMIKRSTIKYDVGLLRLVSVVENIIKNENTAKKMIGCSIFLGLYQEFAITLKSADVGLAWEQHYTTKVVFENSCLRRIFNFVCGLLREISDQGEEVTRDKHGLLAKLITITENTFSWCFVGSSNLLSSKSGSLKRSFFLVLEQEQFPTFKPSANWRDLFEKKSVVVEPFFHLYWKYRDDWEISHHLMNILVQLASSTGPCLARAEQRSTYATLYLECFVQLLDNTKIKEVEAQGISTIFRKLMLFFPARYIVQAPRDLFNQFLEHLTNLTCEFVIAAAAEANVDPEEQMFTEASEQMISAWVVILEDFNVPAEIKRKAPTIFEVWLRCHLSPPHGKRLVLENTEETDAVPDRVAYREQINCIGTCGHQDPSISVPLLTQLLEERITALNQVMSQAVAAGLNSSTNVQEFEALYEDLHWLLLVAAEILSTTPNDRWISIPSVIMEWSVACSQNVDQKDNLELLFNPAKGPEEFPKINHVDPFIRMICAVLRLVEVESQAIQANLLHLISPEVSCSLMWFLRKFALAYLFFEEEEKYDFSRGDASPDRNADDPKPISMSFSMCFGKNSEGANYLLEYLLSFVEKTLRLRCSEQALVEDAVLVLVSLFNKKDASTQMFSSNVFQQFVELLNSGILVKSSPAAQRGLLQAILLAVALVPNRDDQQSVLKVTVEPVVLGLLNTVMGPDFEKTREEEHTKITVVSMLDQLYGVTEGTEKETAEAVFRYLGEIIPVYVKILKAYCNYPHIVEQVLLLYFGCSRKVYAYLNTASSNKYLQGTIDILEAYHHLNIGKRALSRDNEDDQMRDLQMILELLLSLLTKFQFVTDPDNAENEQHTPGDVALYGVSLIMPLMNVELLKLPSLGTYYYDLIHALSEFCPEKVLNMVPDVRKNIFSSIELGLSSFGSDIGLMCFEVIQALGYQLISEPQVSAQEEFKPFLKLVIDILLSGRVNSDLYGCASDALFNMIILFPNEYQNLLDSVIDAQTSDMKKQRLTAAFNELMTDLTFTCSRSNRQKFREKCEYMIGSVRLFLLVK